MKNARRWTAVACLCLILVVGLQADVLVLRDGRRVQGRLIAVNEGLVEFEVQRGRFNRERMRVEQAEVVRIEFDEFTRPGDGGDTVGGPGKATDGGRPSGMREREVTVPAELGWRDTGLMLRAGQTIYFAATGRVRWGPGRQDGPGGERNSPRNDARPIPSRPGAALIGRVGEGAEYFFIGDDGGPVRVRNDGRLYLGINDDFLADNSGSFRVTVYY